MRFRRIRTGAVCLGMVCLALLASSASAVEFGPTPIQNAIEKDIQLANWQAATDFSFDKDKKESGTNSNLVTGRKSIFRAALYSALLPGGGQYYLGNRKKARYFFAAEALTWIGYISFHSYGNWRKDDYIRHASIYASADIEGRGDEFADLVGFYSSIDDYNRAGRVTDPDRPYLADTPENHWQWESDEAQLVFRDLKNSSRESYRRSDLMIGIAVVDRLVSLIDAVRSTLLYNRQIGNVFSESRDRSFKFSVQPFSSRCQVKLTLMTGL